MSDTKSDTKKKQPSSILNGVQLRQNHLEGENPFLINQRRFVNGVEQRLNNRGDWVPVNKKNK